MPDNVVEYIKNKVSIFDVVSKRVKLRRVGKDWFGLCPFHHEKSPSFKVDIRSGTYYCFACGVRGDIFDFMMNMEKMTFPEALEYFANAHGVTLPKKKGENINPHKKEYDALEMIKLWFAKQLSEPNGAEAKKYLESRKISDEFIQKFQLGFAADDNLFEKFLKNQKISEEILLKIGVCFKSYSGDRLLNRYIGRLIFPILDFSGKCIGFGGRTFGANSRKDIAKYINSPESEIYIKNQSLYGFAQAKKGKSKDIIFVEGYLDVISMHQAGFDRTVAPLGTALSETQMNMCWKFCDTPIIMLDGDNAGVKASYRWIDRILPELKPGKSFRVARLPQNTDPDSLIFNGRIDVINDALQNAISLAEWLWHGAFLLYPSETPEQKASILKMVMEKVGLIKDPSLKKLYFNEIKENEKNLYKKKFQKSDKNDTSIRPVISANEKFEKILVVTIINHPYILDRVIELFTNINFKIPITVNLKNSILECYTKFFINGRNEEYIYAIGELKKQIGNFVADIVLHADFVEENVSDEDAIDGWMKIYETYSLQPEVVKDLQNASSSLKLSFSESDWQRLKSLKTESLLIKK